MRVLWDFDGTLFDTYPSYSETLHKALEERFSEEEILKELKVSFGHAIEFFNITESVLKRYRDLEQAKTFVSKPPFPGVIDVLKQTDRNVIMTHKEREDVEALLKYYKMEDLFAEAVCEDDGFSRKPDPESYHYLHERHQLDLVIGDRELDILPGNKIGVKTCLFQNPKTPGADFYLDDYQQFFDVIKP